MHVVGHEAVRNQCKLTLARATQDVRSHQIHFRGVDEEPLPSICAESQEIVVLTDVGQLVMVWRVGMGHALP